MKQLLDNIRNNKIFIILTLFFCFIVFLIVVPHYDDDGTNVLIGKHHSPRSVRIKKKEKELEEYKTQNLTNLTVQIINLKRDKEKMLEDHKEEVEILKEQISTLTNKLSQQENFYTNKKKEDDKIKKVSFSNISKKQIRNDRPQFGNSFSKAIKKSKVDL